MEKDSTKIFKENYTGREDSLQNCLIELKKAGFSQLETVKILTDELGISLREADSIVLNAKAWEQEKEATLKFREYFERVSEESKQKPDQMP